MTMSALHLKVWEELRNLPDGERLLGRELQERAGIEEERYFHSIIEDLRDSGLAIGASRRIPMGYIEIRLPNEMKEYVDSRRAELRKESKRLDKMEREWKRAYAERLKKG